MFVIFIVMVVNVVLILVKAFVLLIPLEADDLQAYMQTLIDGLSDAVRWAFFAHRSNPAHEFLFPHSYPNLSTNADRTPAQHS